MVQKMKEPKGCAKSTSGLIPGNPSPRVRKIVEAAIKVQVPKPPRKLSKESLEAGALNALPYMWKPGVGGGGRGLPARGNKTLRECIREATAGGTLLAEFAIRVLLGQDLRLYREFAPLMIKTKNGGKPGTVAETTTPQRYKAALKRLQDAMCLLEEPPKITMDDRRWAAQFLAAYGWGLPGRAPDHKEEGDADRDLVQRANALVRDFTPQGPEEQARLKRVLEMIEDPEGTYSAGEGAQAR